VANFRRIITATVLTGVLFILPIGSWFYLRDGVRYRKARLSALSDFGHWGATNKYIPRTDIVFGQTLNYYTPECTNWNTPLTNGNALGLDSLERCITVVHTFDPLSNISKEVAPQIERIQKAFGEERTDIKVLSIPVSDADTNDIRAFAKQYPQRKDTWFVALRNDNNMGENLKIAENKKTTDLLKYGALIDQNNTIRQYYDLTNKAEVNKLVEIISIIMKPKPSPKIRFRRRGEK
jgi:hypothetical protein